MEPIPLEVFEGAGDAVFTVDGHGNVQTMNAPAELLLGCDRRAVLGEPCWKVARMRYRNGTPFCGPDCPVQRQAQRDTRFARSWVARRRRQGRPLELELFTLVLPGKTNGRHPVLHLLAPAAAPSLRGKRGALRTDSRGAGSIFGIQPEAIGADEISEDVVQATDRLELLSPREREILGFLSLGHSTPRIAEELCISPNTVRNHVRSILEKLKVHRRLEAALAWLRGRS